MDYEARLELIRSMMGHRPIPVFTGRKALGQFLAANPHLSPATRAKLRREERQERQKLRSDLFGLKLHERTNHWVKKLPERRESRLKISRRWPKNPLYRIAEQLPGKLPKIGT